MAVHLPRPADRERQPADHAGRRAGPFLADLGQRHERVLRPAARQHDLHDERHDDAAEPAGRRAGHFPRPVQRITAATAFSDMHFDVRARRRQRTSRPGSQATRQGGRVARRRQLRRARQAEHATSRRSTYRRADPDLFQPIATQKLPPGPGPQDRPPDRPVRRGRSTSMLGKLSWAAIPFDQPIPLVAAGIVGLVIIGVLGLGHR